VSIARQERDGKNILPCIGGPGGSPRFRGPDESETFIRIRRVHQNYEDEKNSQSSSKIEEKKISKSETFLRRLRKRRFQKKSSKKSSNHSILEEPGGLPDLAFLTDQSILEEPGRLPPIP
jgi:hypothetical protein